MKNQFNNLPELLATTVEKYSEKTALSIANGVSYTYNEIQQLAFKVAEDLFGAGVEKGDKISIIGENSPHWTASYFGIQKAGGIVVPILTDFSSSEMFAILEHAEASIVFITNKQLDKFKDGFPPSVKFLVTLEHLILYPVSSLNSLLKKEFAIAKLNLSEKQDESLNYPEVHKDDLAVIIYTSGTTGRSKGVMLSHDNLIFNAIQTGTVHQVIDSDVFLSVLPLAHTYESTIGMIIPILNGASVVYIDRAPTASYLGPILNMVRPTTMLTVPLIIEKIYRNKIKIGIEGSPLTRILSKFGFTRKVIHKAAGKKLMAFFGGRMRFFGVGGAALAPDVEKFLIEAKFPYAIGYGLTETSPMLAGFAPADAVYKSVGEVMEGVDIRIDNPDPITGEGEIVAKGRNIMHGYYKNEEATKEVFTEDGYFKTGDLGLIDKKGILYIKGRLKNMILGANGENIYPEEIESVINEQEFVTESLVMQVKGKLVAKVHLNYEHLEEKYKHLITSANNKQHELNDKAEEILEELKLHVNQRMSKNSRLQLVILQVDPFEKTPTLKIKRFKYKD
ncbi:AMP-binding protein [Bacteroidota bacterium]